MAVDVYILECATDLQAVDPERVRYAVRGYLAECGVAGDVRASDVATNKKEADEEAERRIIAKRNNDSDVQSARERYLQRKRQKLDPPANDTDMK